MAVLEERPAVLYFCALPACAIACACACPHAREPCVLLILLSWQWFATMLYRDKHNIVDRLESEILGLTGIRLGLRL